MTNDAFQIEAGCDVTGDEPEGSDPRQYWFFRKEVAGTLAMWAVRQSPYVIPERLTDAIQAMHDALPDEGVGMFAMTEPELRETVERICLTDPIIAAWSVPKSGHTATVVFSSRYDSPAADDDFIDLHALAGNISRTLLAEQDDYAASCDGSAERQDAAGGLIGEADDSAVPATPGDAQPHPHPSN